MHYRIVPQANALKLYRDPHSGSKLPYHTIKEMRQLYPNGNFAVIGEIGGFARRANDGDHLIIMDGKSIPILPRGSLIKPLERVAGYVAVDENTYLAVIRSMIAIFSQR